ncbi:NADPH-dependent 2,4-dienoyl-CoA reductase/sulfur reductase-like enzyme [Streptomyces tendae]|uniref:NAD(P)/FAD-dependent oxidoreductase n=1 Tax=Streptomyces tendae TaxID=1932 RepID=UPI003835B195
MSTSPPRRGEPLRRVLIVGASLAAVHAIEALRQHGYEGEIALVGAEPHLAYDRPPLSKEALRAGPDLAALLLKEPAWYTAQSVDLHLGRPAVALDTLRREVTVECGLSLAYDGLVIASGSTARAVGDGNRPFRVLRSVADAADLHARLVPGRHLVVIGAGFVGLEVAATAREMGLDVSVVELAPAPLARVLGDEAGAWFTHHHAGNGVDLHFGTSLEYIETGPRGTTLRLRDGTVLQADLVVGGIGATPATDWLAGSGVRLSDGVVCDPSLATSVPGVVAAGDVARWYNALFDESMRIEQWSNAVQQGRRAALTLLGCTDPFAPVPYLWSDQFDAKMRFVGRANAAQDVRTIQLGDASMVTLFGRDGVLRGALCVNAPRQLARYRQAIRDRVAWCDALTPA